MMVLPTGWTPPHKDLIVLCHYASTPRTDLHGLRPPGADRCGPGGAGEGKIRFHPLCRRALSQGQGAPADRGAAEPGLLRPGLPLARGDRGAAGRAGMAERWNRGEIWLLDLPRPTSGARS